MAEKQTYPMQPPEATMMPLKPPMFLASTLVLCFVSLQVSSEQNQTYLRHGKASLKNILLPGAHLNIAFGPIPNTMDRLELFQDNKGKILRSLKDLRNAVTISDDVAALTFVRLRNSQTTWNFWDSPQFEVEITDTLTVGRLPNYGLKPIYSYVRQSSGFMGVLSSRAYQSGGFAPPVVEQASAGWRITRWIFVTDYTTGTEQISVQKIREFVGKDGEYRREILKKMSPPKLPSTSWYIPEST